MPVSSRTRRGAGAEALGSTAPTSTGSHPPEQGEAKAMAPSSVRPEGREVTVSDVPASRSWGPRPAHADGAEDRQGW